MKALVVRNLLLLAPVLFAVAAAVLIAQAGTGGVDGASTKQPMMSIPF